MTTMIKTQQFLSLGWKLLMQTIRLWGHPSQNPQTKIDFSGDIIVAMNDFEGQTSLNVTPDKQTPDMVRRGVLSQALLS